MSDLLLTDSRRSGLAPLGGEQSWVALADLAMVQAVRTVRHPVFLLGVVLFLMTMGAGVPDTPYEVYLAVSGMVAYFLGPLAFFAANLVASSGRRSGTDEWAPSLPMSAARRTTALLLACLAPAAVAAAVNLALVALVARGDVVAGMAVRWQHVASVPLTVLGGAVLGVAVARLLPWPGLPLVVMVGLVTFNAWVAGSRAYLGFFVDFASYTDGTVIPGLVPGEPSWHLIYLASLCGLAASGAYLRDGGRRWLPFASGALFGSLALLAGAAQLG